MPNDDATAWEEQLIADLRANGGKPSGGPLAGHPILLMYSTGAKSGLRRRSILTYSVQGDTYVVAGTASGSPVDPAWIANVAADPTVELEVANEVFAGRAEVVDPAERDQVWAEHVAQLPWFAKYQEQVERTIPVVRLRRA
ncbi:MAG TPA: nitroreductase/quinone reductase family protein [Candidatus Limnocylindria bacterium]|nr:nitroreductase/quinone reductase family protein [Candidatus Limnocylindria bacterium]